MNATTFVRMPTSKQMLAMGVPELPEAAFGGDLPPMQRKALVKAMGIRPQGGGGGGLKAVVGVVAAIAIPFAAPYIVGSIAASTAVAAAMPAVTAALSTTAGAVVGSAIVGAGLGAVTAAATGQNVGRGALFGAIGGGIGGYTQASQITAQGANVGTGSTSITASGTPVATTPTANAVVTNVGSGTGYWSPELGQFVDPRTGNTILSQNIAYGGQVNSTLANQLSSGAASAQDVANAITGGVGAASPGVSSLSVNTPVAMGGNAAALGSANYYNPNLAPTTFGGAGSAYTEAANAGGTYAAQTSPAYAQAGLRVTPAMEQAAANSAVQSGSMVNVAGKGGAATTTVSAPAGGATAAGGAATAPVTLSEALKAKFTDPRNQADMLLRAAGQIAGSALAGDGLSPEEKDLLNQQTAELRQLRETNQELFNQRLQEAQNIIGESKYFDPAYFGMQSSRAVQTAGARAKREALGRFGSRNAGLRNAEGRRFDLGIATGSQTAYLQGADAAIKNRVNTAVTGANLIPTSGPTAGLQYGSYVGGLYDAAERRRRASAGDIGDLFGTFTAPRTA
jgi:hypothetical protein